MTELTTDKHEQFCRQYVILRNATDAAKRVGYSEASAYNQGYRLLQREDILKRIEELDQVDTTTLDVIREIEDTFKTAKSKGSTTGALKALELLSKIKNGSDGKVKSSSSTELEKDIVAYMERLGKNKVFDIISRCSFMADNAFVSLEEHNDQQEEEEEDGDGDSFEHVDSPDLSEEEADEEEEEEEEENENSDVSNSI